MNHRDRQILCGLFLSKFDQQGLTYLGFEGFSEAFNALGYSLQARPASIKNYRDELDPYFPNARKGWHKRPLREHCQRVLNDYRDNDIGQLGELIKSFLMPAKEVDSMPEVKRVLNIHDVESSSSFAKRLIRDKYYLVLVRNFMEEPFHTVINNPADCAMRFTKVERKEIRFSWTANVVE